MTDTSSASRVPGDAARRRLRADAASYAACYCEENVARRLQQKSAAFALMVCNSSRTVLMGCQVAGQGASVVWDYHVVLLDGCADSAVLVYDLDSTLPYPTALADYLAASFPRNAPTRLRPRFRLVEGCTFLSRFASDRRHMKAADGTWLAAPPIWPPIRGTLATSVHTFDEFLDLSNEGGDVCGVGTIVADVDQLMALTRQLVQPEQEA